MYGVLDEKSVLELFQGALALLPFLARFFLPCTDHQGRMKARKKLYERVGKDNYGLKKGGRNQIFPKSLLYIKNNVYLCDSNQNLQNMTKRILLSIFAMMALTTAAAQDTVSGFRFGYLSYEAALQSMADYQQVQQKMDQMRQQFQAETLRVEDEFNLKYEEFLDGQRDFPKTILQKRQSELTAHRTAGHDSPRTRLCLHRGYRPEGNALYQPLDGRRHQPDCKGCSQVNQAPSASSTAAMAD